MVPVINLGMISLKFYFQPYSSYGLLTKSRMAEPGWCNNSRMEWRNRGIERSTVGLEDVIYFLFNLIFLRLYCKMSPIMLYPQLNYTFYPRNFLIRKKDFFSNFYCTRVNFMYPNSNFVTMQKFNRSPLGIFINRCHSL